MKKKVWGVITSLILIISLTPLSVHAASPKVVISEIKLGGTVTGQPTEFAAIYNDSDAPVDVTGWLLEYAKPAAKLTDCAAPSWKAVDSSANVKEQQLQGVIAPASQLIVELSLTDNAGGSLRLSNAGTVYDLVGWGNTVSHSVCAEGEQAPIPASTKSIKRHFDDDGYIVDRNNNNTDFIDPVVAPSQPSSPDPDPSQTSTDVCTNLNGLQTVVPDGYEVANGQCTKIPSLPAEACSGVSISEILPNPSGTDTGTEYIELYNSTDKPVDLSGCSLVVGSSHKDLSGTIQPGYQAFYGLTLPNAAGGTVTFITPTTEDVVNYPANLQDNVAYALIDGEWQITNQPTPNAANQQSVEIVVATTTTTTTTSTLTPCPAGKYRNPATNRCKNIESSNLKACDAGQYRNPATNRCKSLAATLTSLKACDAGQERNPATNRCKKITTASSTLKPCNENQERNPATNRCRKVAGVTTASANNVSPENSAPKPTLSYAAFAAVAVFALGYGVYEYRDNIANYFVRMRAQLKK